MTKTGTAVVRPLRADDRAQWDALWTDYLTFYETALDRTVYDRTFARVLGNDPNQFSCLVAENDTGLVGLTHYLFHAHAWKIERVCYLQDLFVSPTTRGTGAGRALIEAVYGEADRQGAPSVYWMTQDTNATARQLYDRVGTLTPFVKYARPSA